MVYRSTKKSWNKGAPWDGVRNYQAAKNLKSMKKVINVFFITQILEKKLLVLLR